MRGILSLLLILLIVLGQGLSHSHAGTGVAEPTDHAARPHIHLSVGHSHHHHHDGNDHHDHDDVSELEDVTTVALGWVSDVVDHDGDAIYLAQSASTLSRVSKSLSTGAASISATLTRWTLPPNPSAVPHHRHVVHESDGRHIYLLVESLRL